MTFTYLFKVRYFKCQYLVNDDTMAKMRDTGFIDFDICNRMAPLQKLYFVILTYFFNVKYFLC